MKRSIPSLTLLAIATLTVAVDAEGARATDILPHSSNLATNFSPVSPVPPSPHQSLVATFQRNGIRKRDRSLLVQNRPEPPTTGTPDGPQRGGGTRPAQESNCSVEGSFVLAFLPETANISPGFSQFWLYVPYPPADIEKLRFILQDEAGAYVVPATTLPLSGTPGFISVPLPPLETNKSYTWTVSIFCDADDSEDRISLSGVVRSIASEGSWYEEFNRLAELRRSGVADEALLTEWTDLLEFLNLSKLIAEPMTNCCSP